MKIKVSVRAWLFVLCMLDSSALAGDACNALNLVEVNAALRGPGQVLSAHGELTDKTGSICTFKKTTGGPYTTGAALHAAPGPEISIVIKDPGAAPIVDSKTMDAEPPVPSLGDRATVISGPVGNSPGAQTIFRVAVISGSQSYILVYQPGGVDPQSRATAVQLAREVLAGQFWGNLTSYPIAELVIANDKTEIREKQDSIELWNEIGLLSEGLKRYEDSRDAYAKVSQLLPDDPGGYFGVALADWQRTFGPLMQLRNKLGVRPMDGLSLDRKYKDECEAFEKDFRAIIDEGYKSIKKALQLRPQNGDYAAYASFLAREMADTDCGDETAAKSDRGEVDHFAQMSNENKRTGTSDPKSYESKIAVGPFPPSPPPPPPGTAMGGVMGSVLSSIPATSPNMGNSDRIPVSSGIESGLLLTRVNPVYPPLARQARIQGTVSLKALIAKDGGVEHLDLISGHPMLVPAAMDAVKQWKYKPYLQNGHAVAVQTVIQVNFSLQKDPPPQPAPAAQQ